MLKVVLGSLHLMTTHLASRHQLASHHTQKTGDGRFPPVPPFDMCQLEQALALCNFDLGSRLKAASFSAVTIQHPINIATITAFPVPLQPPLASPFGLAATNLLGHATPDAQTHKALASRES